MSGVVQGLIASLVSAAGAVTDTFFRYVSLLLNTSATNGAQNNTFLDGSTNAFSITRNGNTTQGTFSPFSQTGWSNYFAGGTAENRLSTTQTAIGTGNFTVALWVNLTSVPNDGQIFDTGTNGFSLYITTGNQLAFFDRASVLNIISPSVSTAISVGVWTHVAIVRSGTGTGQTALYINGTSVATGTAAQNFSSTTVSIGARFAVSGANWFAFNGYLSNVLYADSALTITVPTAPYTNASGVKLLTCQSNRFIDNSSNAFAITRNGDVSVQAFSPFNPTAAWDASTNGGSGYFDGTGDYLSVADNVALEPGTGDFCLETWVYFNALTIGNIYNAQQSGPSIAINASNQIEFGQSYVSVLLTDTVAATTGQWYHVAVCRSGTTLSMFVNGSRRATATNSTNFNTTVANYIGWNGGAAYFNGYLSNLRLVKGSAVYDPTLTTLTVPTAPLTAITNTSLLLNFTNAGIYDSASGNDLETVGNAQVSTVQAKWGTTSMAFDGTGDSLTAVDSPRLELGAADFTIEMWAYYNAVGGASGRGTLSKGSTTGASFLIFQGATNELAFYASSNGTTWDIASAVQFSSNIPLNTWHHLAVTRSGSTFRVFLNGTQANTFTSTASLVNNTAPVTVGAYGSLVMDGYIDDLRITNGYARYTANFTPPTAAFPLN